MKTRRAVPALSLALALIAFATMPATAEHPTSVALLPSCPQSLHYAQAVPTSMLKAMRTWAHNHGFTVRTAHMARALPLALYTKVGKCQQPGGPVLHLVKAPRKSTEVRSVLATIRYPGSDAQQPSPGSPYFLLAKVGGKWHVVRSDGTGLNWGA